MLDSIENNNTVQYSAVTRAFHIKPHYNQCYIYSQNIHRTGLKYRLFIHLRVKLYTYIRAPCRLHSIGFIICLFILPTIFVAKRECFI